jgi:predicted PurR-regulated permease PerM
VPADAQLEHDRLLLARGNVAVVRHSDPYLRRLTVGQGQFVLDRGAAQRQGLSAGSVEETSGGSGMLPPVAAERVIRFRIRTVLTIFALAIAVWALLHLVAVARHVLVWIVISMFLALAINPFVDWLQRRGLHRRGFATTVAFVVVLLGVVAVGALFIPTLVDNVNKFVAAVPGYVDDLTKGKGRLGFLETKYHFVEKIREQLDNGGAKRLLGLTGAAISVTKGVVNIVIGTITVIFLTFFMLLEGPKWVERFYGLLSPESQPRWRAVGRDIYKQIGGYVTGNLVISLIAGTLTTLVLLVLGVPYAVALGLIVALLDLIPLAGATIAAIIIAAVAFLHTIVAGIVVVVFFIIYQQLENHVLQPLVYRRTVALSPLVILISVLIGAEVAGVLGALAAIPVAGAIQVLVIDFLRARRERAVETPAIT